MMGLEHIHQARERIAKIIKRTPLMCSNTIDEKIGNQLFLKCEHLQKTGSFKLRGASNKVIFEAEHNARYVVAASSGNHGQAVAYIANQLGLKSTIVVPENAATCKQEAIKAYHGGVEFCGFTSGERIERAKQICEDEQAVFIPPYDDPLVIAGQGTAGLEILEQLDQIDEVYVPIGGGGLISGIATAIKESNPRIRVIGVEPTLANDTYLSYHNGKRINIGVTTTIADGLRTSIPGELTFPIVQKYVDEIVLVEEEAIKRAFTLVFTRMKQVIEPSGAISIAAAMESGARGKRIVALVSGGNVDTAVIPSLLIE
ncbi:threonine ammonia-lyase [Ammoniphilus resinae]|uniref:Threonine dehydratase n=1 Tax=Ammoniphilus resinae TaxID=861532 RepID=A0ABS4GIU2_9BACL|nr:threonine/serine dehydratase [Ammoniphilus resinae]MBP1930171.1 threonine dehydratase [Ammoniphilus resinae]